MNFLKASHLTFAVYWAELISVKIGVRFFPFKKSADRRKA
jgi:hypothetical protein